MASGVNGWSAYQFPSVTTQATCTIAALGNAATQSQVPRVRAIQICVAGASALSSGQVEFVLRNGASGVGTILAAWVLQANSATGHSLSMSGLDIRATGNNALTLESTAAGATGSQVSVAMQGDFIPAGQGFYSTTN